MINLFDHYHQQSWDLHFSLLKAGYTHPTVVIQDDGFLPEDVTSPYLYFTGFGEATGYPLYFNDLPLPRFWEIRSTNQQAEVFDLHEKKAIIHFSPAHHNRLVKTVDWLDSKGRVRFIDRYNRFGARFAQTTLSEQGESIKTSYYNRKQQEVIVEHHATGSILLQDGGKQHVFANREQFVAYYLQVAGFDLDRIFYNSLSTPFFVTLSLPGAGDDILFWQESIAEDIPGNMRFLFDQSPRTTKVVVQDKATYEKLLPLLTEAQRECVSYVGFLYPFKEEREEAQDALILTNSDQIEQLESLIQAVPDLQFHIAALTEMSGKLMRMGEYPNVQLYPNITVDKARELLKKSSIYLDINHHEEILSAVRAAFEHRLLIFAFNETLHHRQYVAPQQVFPATDVSAMVAQLKSCLEQPTFRYELLQAQGRQANVASEADYQNL
ncbi:accessory Sec system glycosylation chaperone GtfB [Streptococcus sp. zg-86]|uniref:UDP-N-acetylglucosamine--peptide N-acetylglucosaminyltransferase stabilizing protein GtfB n=1 Tax=Streptococcus zhangguiae TaxID=2664091 RepID=A0A6I4RDQ3_9STRE|nr:MULTISPECIES: accessory Sec system glycosylation chaperone GtfB [unclassified Streptococcus]MTB64871.1 accessory Sec system glycosylation chaperone GtfB [Streptococcus sp. zg-86]MTB91059.1 accessory Sec system glycosylation chaperone GtfB [Streptococcus sp. zg-36]MWV56858.1 accessory Sec system glycosylation chaperone GtfB [Streptococcus sp. zg-70]QTH48338.1 accessory Sec system glycosylation chaperone GtfB [Streptococcus sp. zg-86]